MEGDVLWPVSPLQALYRENLHRYILEVMVLCCTNNWVSFIISNLIACRRTLSEDCESTLHGFVSNRAEDGTV